MPINYKEYAATWKTEIRPAILQRANSKCEFCGIQNHIYVFRGDWNGKEVYQTEHGDIYCADTSTVLVKGDLGFHESIQGKTVDQKAIKTVLTIAHLNHDKADNRHENLKALCQRCHNRYDAEYRKANRAKTIQNKKGLQTIF